MSGLLDQQDLLHWGLNSPRNNRMSEKIEVTWSVMSVQIKKKRPLELAIPIRENQRSVQPDDVRSGLRFATLNQQPITSVRVTGNSKY